MAKSKFPLTATPIAKAIKFCLYGSEGVGKSTLASKLPHPIFIDTEGSTEHMTVVRYPRPQSWQDIMDMVADAGNLLHPGNTLIIDTLDWADTLCTRSLCREKKWGSIEDAGYGKGYVMLGEKFSELLARLTELADRGINVGFCAHAQLRKVEKPEETGAYDHWELKCSKRVAPLVKEWADLLLFLNYDSVVVKGNNPMEANRIVGNKRMMYANHQPTFDAKNRFGLPDKLPLEYASIKPVFEPEPKPAPEPIFIPKVQPAPDVETAEPALNEPPQDPDPTDALPEDPFMPELKPESEWTPEDKAQLEPTRLADRYPDLAQLMDAAGVQYAEVQAAVSARGYFPGDMPIELYPADFVKGCLVAAWESVKNLIMDMRRTNNG